MPRIVSDLRCLADPTHIECDVLHERDMPTLCPKCCGPRVVFYATRAMQVSAAASGIGFQPVEVCGVVCNSPEERDAQVKAYCDRHGKDPANVELHKPTIREVRVHADELRHQAWEMRKADGYDTQKFRDYRREQDRQKNHRGTR